MDDQSSGSGQVTALASNVVLQAALNLIASVARAYRLLAGSTG